MNKQGLLALFFFLAALILTLIGSGYFSHVLLFVPLAVLIVSLAIYSEVPIKGSWLSLVLVLFVINIFISIFVYSPVYDAAATYYILYLVFGYLLASNLNKALALPLYQLIIGVFILLCIWALVQHFGGMFYLSNSSAPNTIFTTKNTFAAAINFSLLPLVVVYCLCSNTRLVYAVIILLFCGLLVAMSRGAYVAFTAAFLFFSLIGLWKSGLIEWKKWRRLVAGFAICITLINLNGGVHLYNSGITIINSALSFIDSSYRIDSIDEERLEKKLGKVTSESSMYDRLYYYEIALKQISENPVVGYGFLNYKYYFHIDKSEEIYHQNRYRGFVHNDYLQIWVETGLAGILLLVALISLVYFNAYRFLKNGILSQTNLVPMLGIVSALTAYFIHALVDFVMYPPILLLLFGGFLGYLNGLLPENIILKDCLHRLARPIISRKKLAKAIAAIVAIGWLSQPAIAETLSYMANKKMQAAKYDEALDYYLTAINFADYSADYYFNAGRILYTSAERTGNRQHAIEADTLFKQAAAENPFEYHNRYARIKLHRDHPELLDEPATETEILAWFEYILGWQPMNEFITREYIQTLVLYKQWATAEQQLNEYLKYYAVTEELTKIKALIESERS